ncbi:hypothetical protein ACFX11_022963 [Malus domestica]
MASMLTESGRGRYNKLHHCGTASTAQHCFAKFRPALRKAFYTSSNPFIVSGVPPLFEITMISVEANSGPSCTI